MPLLRKGHNLNMRVKPVWLYTYLETTCRRKSLDKKNYIQLQRKPTKIPCRICPLHKWLE